MAEHPNAGLLREAISTFNRGDWDVVLAQAYRINPDGKFTEYWALADDQGAVNAFWS